MAQIIRLGQTERDKLSEFNRKRDELIETIDYSNLTNTQLETIARHLASLDCQTVKQTAN